MLRFFLATLLGVVEARHEVRKTGKRRALRRRMSTEAEKGDAPTYFYANPYEALAAATMKSEFPEQNSGQKISTEDLSSETAVGNGNAFDLFRNVGMDDAEGDNQGNGDVKMDAAPAEKLPQETNFFLRHTTGLQKRKASKSKQVTMKVCNDFAAEVSAMGCSLVTQISGYPEGCICRMQGSSCPDYAATSAAGTFTGASPGNSMFGVALCMYWQWLPSGGGNTDAAEKTAQSIENAKNMVIQAQKYAMANAKVAADPLWQLMPTPFPKPPEE